MAVPTRSRRTAGLQPPGQGLRRGRRRSVPLAAGGVVLVVVCALVFAEGWLAAGHRQPVLALAQPVAAGQVITAPDLQVVKVSASGPLSLVPASRQAQVIGSTAAAGLPAGRLAAAVLPTTSAWRDAGTRDTGPAALTRTVSRSAAVITCPAATGWARARTGCRCPACSQPSAKTSAHATTSTTPPAASGALRLRSRRDCRGGWGPAVRRDRVGTAIVNLRWC